MKKSLLALAVLGAFAGVASAQTNVTIYGIADVGFVFERGGAAGSVTKLTSGVASGSRLGFRGTEDLGGGLSANFTLENGFNLDTGAISGATTTVANPPLFGRQVFVGLKGGFGAVNMGRQYTPHYSILVAADPFGNGMAGKITNVMTSVVRTDNLVKYTAPAMGGFSADVAYGFGEVAGNNSASRTIGLNLKYAAGPVMVGLGFHDLNNATNTDDAKNTLLAGTYDFRVAKAHLAYGINKGTGTVDNRDLMAGVTVPFGASKLLASYIRKDDKSALNRDASQWAIGYLYALSKRTDLYAAYGNITNKNGATFRVGNNTESATSVPAASGDRAFNLGIRHSF